MRFGKRVGFEGDLLQKGPYIMKISPDAMRWAFFILALLGAHLSVGRAQEIAAFWERTLESLAKEPIDAVVEPLNEPLPYKKFRVTLRGLDGVHFRALLALPIRGDSPQRALPVIVSPPGYGGNQQGVMLDECQRGYAILQVFPRSQGPSADLWKIDGSDKLTWRLERPDDAYYRGAYADVVRSIDFLVSRPEIAADRIALVGTSQGGGIALAVASIDPRVKAVVAHVPFLCDMRTAARTPNSLVKRLLDSAGADHKTALRTLDFFDPLQLVPALRVPVLMSVGEKDEVCPPATIRATFDRISSIKTLAWYPDLAHTSSAGFYDMTWPWLDYYLRR